MKFLICGPYLAGKTTFMRSLVHHFSPGSVYKAERGIDTEIGAIRPDFGTMQIEGREYYFYGFGTLKRFDFIYEILAEDCSGYLFIVNSVRTETFLELRRAISLIVGFHAAPYILITNHQDHPDAYPIALMHRALGLDEAAPIVPCVAHDKTSTQAAFEVMLKRIAHTDES